MGAREKLMKKKLSTAASSQLSKSKESPDFLPLEGGPGKKIPEHPTGKSTATVLYVGRIPHGFYEKEMENCFSQFGKIKRLRIARNKKTGKSKHYGFIEFENPEVAEVVADCMNNYLLFEHLLQVYLVPTEHVHPRLWQGYNHRFQIKQRRQSKERTLEGQHKLAEKILKRDQKRRKRIEAAGLEHECPQVVGEIQPDPKRIKFGDD